ncbi:hypothetical protein [Pontibacter ruber]|uniref:PH (Pleckstrin Homology) domain-containing protein n=1 Tax=Pontibacter ruber TaxID=1343895 RepID=A0ABW5CWB6_9BACT|nr:hypothetical protein [Pontibacter ruber]
MKSFNPKYYFGTYLFYPLVIGMSFWLSIGAIGNYQKGIIELHTLLFIIVVSLFLLSWLYLFNKNKFRTIDFYESELVFTNVLGTVKKVKKEEIKNISPLGIKYKNQVLPISFYFMDNRSDLFFCLEEWRNK